MNLNTTYMGLALKNPLIVASSPLSKSSENIQKATAAGAAAVVFFSLFEEQVVKHSERYPYFPRADDYAVTPDAYFDLLHRTVEQSEIPIIGSLNGVTTHGWEEYAQKIEATGAQGLELNIYHVAANPTISGQEIEQQHLDILRAVKSAVDIPIALKLSPFFSSLGHMAKQFDEVGVDALVLFNRFYQPDFDLDAMEVDPALNLSACADIRLPLRWIAMLHGKLRASLAASTGVQTGAEVIKYLLAGADGVTTASSLLKNGPEHIGTLLRELEEWMEANEYTSIDQFRGSMGQKAIANSDEFERANYIKVLETYSRKHL
jgi:dihydroorotate dehydrogenase (fumarate)